MKYTNQIHKEDFWHKGHYWYIKIEGVGWQYDIDQSPEMLEQILDNQPWTKKMQVYLGAERGDQLFFEEITNEESIPAMVSKSKDLIKKYAV